MSYAFLTNKNHTEKQKQHGINTYSFGRLVGKLDFGEIGIFVRKTLGIDDETAFDMHVQAFNAEVRDLLGLSDEDTDLSKVQFTDEAAERVSVDYFSLWFCCFKNTHTAQSHIFAFRR